MQQLKDTIYFLSSLHPEQLKISSCSGFSSLRSSVSKSIRFNLPTTTLGNFYAQEKNTGKESKDDKKSVKPEKIKLLEGTAAKNRDTQKSDETKAINIKKIILQYEMDFKRL